MLLVIIQVVSKFSQYFQRFVHRDLFASGCALRIFSGFVVENAIESTQFFVRMVLPQRWRDEGGIAEVRTVMVSVEDPCPDPISARTPHVLTDFLPMDYFLFGRRWLCPGGRSVQNATECILIVVWY